MNYSLSIAFGPNCNLNYTRPSNNSTIRLPQFLRKLISNIHPAVLQARGGACPESLIINCHDHPVLPPPEVYLRTKLVRNVALTCSRVAGDYSFSTEFYESLVTPMDVVKTRLQTQVQPLTKGECFLYSNGLMDHLCTSCAEPTPATRCEWFNRPGHFNGTVDAFVKISRNEGIRSLWSGLSPTIVSAIPQTVFYFTLYDNLHHRFRSRWGDGTLAPLCAGSCARIVAATTVSPLEMIRTKMQSEIMPYKDLMRGLKFSIGQDGYQMLWRGLTATLLRDVPFSAIYWIGYEQLKQRVINFLGRKETHFFISFFAGGVSGTIASIVTQPFDVVKTHKQITLGKPTGLKRGHVTAAQKPMLQIMGEIVRQGGFSGLFTGLAPRIAKTSTACAIMIGTYEYLKLVFRHRNHDA